MFFTLEKLERNTKQLKDLRYRERMEIPSFDASTPEEEPVGKRPESVVYTGTLKKGDFWIGRGTYLWIRQSVEIPAEFRVRGTDLRQWFAILRNRLLS